MLYASGNPPTSFHGIKGVFAGGGSVPDHIQLSNSHIDWSGSYNPYTSFSGFQGIAFSDPDNSNVVNAFFSGSHISPSSGIIETGVVRYSIEPGVVGEPYRSAGTSGVQDLGTSYLMSSGGPDPEDSYGVGLPWKKIWVNEIGTTELPHGIPEVESMEI